MNIYKEYKTKKHPDDDFLRWILIRKLNLKQQLFFIVILWSAWIWVAPNLKFWVFFFEFVLIYWLISVPIELLFKKIKRKRMN